MDAGCFLCPQLAPCTALPIPASGQRLAGPEGSSSRVTGLPGEEQVQAVRHERRHASELVDWLTAGMNECIRRIRLRHLTPQTGLAHLRGPRLTHLEPLREGKRARGPFAACNMRALEPRSRDLGLTRGLLVTCVVFCCSPPAA